jgi:uncharacterized membrane protein
MEILIKIIVTLGFVVIIGTMIYKMVKDKKKQEPNTGGGGVVIEPTPPVDPNEEQTT